MDRGTPDKKHGTLGSTNFDGVLSAGSLPTIGKDFAIGRVHDQTIASRIVEGLGMLFDIFGAGRKTAPKPLHIRSAVGVRGGLNVFALASAHTWNRAGSAGHGRRQASAWAATSTDATAAIVARSRTVNESLIHFTSLFPASLAYA